MKPEKDAEDFQESYEDPANLVPINIHYCDGAGWNGKISKIAFGKQGSDIKVIEVNENKTNNEVEYLALITAMLFAEDDDLIFTDSSLVVNQITNNWKVNFEHLEKLRDVARKVAHEKRITIRWTPREKNLAGIHLDKIKKVKKK